MIRKLGLAPIAGALFALACAGGATAQPEKSKDKNEQTLDRVGHIASQPVRDIGISKDKIPDILQAAVKAPYAAANGRKCSAITGELASLNGALGPDFGSDPQANEDKATRLAVTGGELVVNSLIPLRGVVREVSGAASADRRMAAAVSAGIARRGYLRGLAAARGCRIAAAKRL